MERIYAFTDESGAFGWDLTNLNVSTHFIITSIIVKESDIDVLRANLQTIRQKHFQTGEIKSAKIGKDDNKRKRVLADCLSLPFSIFSVVCAKRELRSNPGLQYKQSFYKFLNNIVHKELRKAFKILTIVADEIGGSEYMQSFSNYVKEKQDIPSLFGEAEFFFQKSSNDVIIQLADLISGTLARIYDEHKISSEAPIYKNMLEKKTTRVQFYPQNYSTYTVEDSAIAEDYDKDIAELCFKQAAEFVNIYDNSDDTEREAQVIVLKYLLFRFMNNDLRSYIPTHELRNQLKTSAIGSISVQSFRTRIIAKLRDNGVIIASSPKGYKIPSKQTELYDFINHGTTIIMPMLSRLKKCRDLVKLGSMNTLDLFDHTEYISLKKYFDE